MVKHIVMWKLKEEHNGMTKDELILEMSNRLIELKDKISELVDLQIGINGIHFEKNSDLVLITDFNSFEDLATYAAHPDHIKVVGFAKEIVVDRACVDYEY